MMKFRLFHVIKYGQKFSFCFTLSSMGGKSLSILLHQVWAEILFLVYFIKYGRKFSSYFILSSMGRNFFSYERKFSSFFILSSMGGNYLSISFYQVWAKIRMGGNSLSYLFCQVWVKILSLFHFIKYGRKFSFYFILSSMGGDSLSISFHQVWAEILFVSSYRRGFTSRLIRLKHFS